MTISERGMISNPSYATIIGESNEGNNETSEKQIKLNSGVIMTRAILSSDVTQKPKHISNIGCYVVDHTAIEDKFLSWKLSDPCEGKNIQIQKICGHVKVRNNKGYILQESRGVDGIRPSNIDASIKL